MQASMIAFDRQLLELLLPVLFFRRGNAQCIHFFASESPYIHDRLKLLPHLGHF
jgi:hypothetical protein